MAGVEREVAGGGCRERSGGCRERSGGWGV